MISLPSYDEGGERRWRETQEYIDSKRGKVKGQSLKGDKEEGKDRRGEIRHQQNKRLLVSLEKPE